MAGTWMSIVEGFGGMRVVAGKLSFNPVIPEQWEEFSFKVNFRGQILKIEVSPGETRFTLEGSQPINILHKGKALIVEPKLTITA